MAAVSQAVARRLHTVVSHASTPSERTRLMETMHILYTDQEICVSSSSRWRRVKTSPPGAQAAFHCSAPCLEWNLVRLSGVMGKFYDDRTCNQNHTTKVQVARLCVGFRIPVYKKESSLLSRLSYAEFTRVQQTSRLCCTALGDKTNHQDIAYMLCSAQRAARSSCFIFHHKNVMSNDSRGSPARCPRVNWKISSGPLSSPLPSYYFCMSPYFVPASQSFAIVDLRRTKAVLLAIASLAGGL